VDVLMQDHGRRIGRERRPAGQDFVQEHAEAVDVARGRLGLAFGLLRGHVAGRADLRGEGVGGCVVGAGDAEIGQYRAAVRHHNDVGRLDVPMDHPTAVREVQRGRYPFQQAERGRGIGPGLRQPGLQGRAFQ
jgi:hypothetical protein